MTARTRARIDRLWRYYQHADDLQHRRLGLLFTIQAFLVGGFVALPDHSIWLRLLVVVAGTLFVVLWFTLIWTVERGMARLNRELSYVDAAYARYLSDVRPGHGVFSGRMVLRWYLPTVMLALWVGLFSAWLADTL